MTSLAMTRKPSPSRGSTPAQSAYWVELCTGSSASVSRGFPEFQRVAWWVPGAGLLGEWSETCNHVRISAERTARTKEALQGQCLHLVRVRIRAPGGGPE